MREQRAARSVVEGRLWAQATPHDSHRLLDGDLVVAREGRVCQCPGGSAHRLPDDEVRLGGMRVGCALVS